MKMQNLKMKDQMTGHENAIIPHFQVLHFQSTHDEQRDNPRQEKRVQ